MTGNQRRPGAPSGPPWSVDLLAELHAGALDEAVAAELRPRVEADAEGRAVLAALEATRADLANLPPLRMPGDVAARLEAALAAEARGQAAGVPAPRPAPTAQPPAEGLAPVIDIAEARRRRNRRLGWGGGLLAAAAIAVGVVVVAVPGADHTSGTPNAQSAPNPGSSSAATGSAPLAVRSDNLGAAVPKLLQSTNYGALKDQNTLAGCLAGGGIQNTTPLGVGPITLDGKDEVMAILPSGKLGEFRVVVLDPTTCGPNNPNGVIGNSTIAPPSTTPSTR